MAAGTGFLGGAAVVVILSAILNIKAFISGIVYRIIFNIHMRIPKFSLTLYDIIPTFLI